MDVSVGLVVLSMLVLVMGVVESPLAMLWLAFASVVF